MSEIQAIEKSLPVAGPDEIDVVQIARTLWRERIQIAITAIITTVVVISASFLLPKQYLSEATILPSSSSDPSSSIAAGILSQFGAAGALSGVSLSNSRTADLVEVLSSRSMAERVIQKCHLTNEIRGGKTPGDLVDRVMKMTKVISPDLKSKIITIKVKAPRAKLASDMANTYVVELKSMLDEIGYNSATKNRKFIEQQLIRTKEDLSRAESELTNFQSQTHLASLPDTVVASIKSMSDLESQRISAEVQLKTTNEALETVRTGVSSLQADPESMLQLEMKRKTLLTQEAALESAKSDFLKHLSGLPPKAMKLARLQRDVQVQNAIYLALSQQYEMAMISENKDSDAFITLDRAEVPDSPSGPRKAIVALIGVFSGLFLGILTSLVRSSLDRMVVG